MFKSRDFAVYEDDGLVYKNTPEFSPYGGDVHYMISANDVLEFFQEAYDASDDAFHTLMCLGAQPIPVDVFYSITDPERILSWYNSDHRAIEYYDLVKNEKDIWVAPDVGQISLVIELLAKQGRYDTDRLRLLPETVTKVLIAAITFGRPYAVKALLHHMMFTFDEAVCDDCVDALAALDVADWFLNSMDAVCDAFFARTFELRVSKYILNRTAYMYPGVIDRLARMSSSNVKQALRDYYTHDQISFVKELLTSFKSVGEAATAEAGRFVDKCMPQPNEAYLDACDAVRHLMPDTRMALLYNRRSDLDSDTDVDSDSDSDTAASIPADVFSVHLCFERTEGIDLMNFIGQVPQKSDMLWVCANIRGRKNGPPMVEVDTHMFKRSTKMEFPEASLRIAFQQNIPSLHSAYVDDPPFDHETMVTVETMNAPEDTVFKCQDTKGRVQITSKKDELLLTKALTALPHVKNMPIFIHM